MAPPRPHMRMKMVYFHGNDGVMAAKRTCTGMVIGVAREIVEWYL